MNDPTRPGSKAYRPAEYRLATTVLVIVSGWWSVTPPLAAQTPVETSLTRSLDSLARAHAARSEVVGVSVGVVAGPDTLLLGGYGSVDLEWHVPTPTDADAVYEIGSVTKQFTSAAVLLLAEEGKLDLDADLTRYLPEYDTQGRRIPVRRLLDHTSGIKGYTEMPAFGELVMRDLPRDSLVARFEAEPLEFEPGSALIYNNSAYFLLGLIIEEVSGVPYEEFVASRLFGPLGMSRSSYCDERAVIDGRANGYDPAPEGFRRTAYLDHTWPFAAGSLCSTVPDLLRWNAALHGGRVLSPASYRAMTTPAPLSDGTPIRYAMGLEIDRRGNDRIIAHGGGINGFLSDAVYVPDRELTVVVLQNNVGPVGPGALTQAILEAVLGPAPAATERAYAGPLAPFTGTYTGPARGQELTVEVSIGGDGMLRVATAGQDPGGPLRWDGGLTWTRGTLQYRFECREGALRILRVDSGFGHYVLARAAAPTGPCVGSPAGDRPETGPETDGKPDADGRGVRTGTNGRPGPA